MLNKEHRALALRHQPYIFADVNDPFPIRLIGCTVFTGPGRSGSFKNLLMDPGGVGAAAIIEYAIYYDYDIQHLYDLEHIWVAVDADGNVTDCWCSFHGMRLRAAGIRGFRVEDGHPVLYSQPGKHAMMPVPELFELHPQLHTACSLDAGGGLLIPAMLEGKMETDAARDERIHRYIRERFSFTPSFEFRKEALSDRKFVAWPELLEQIPKLVAEQLKIIEE